MTVDLQQEASSLLDAIGPLSDRDLNAVATGSLGKWTPHGTGETYCFLEAIAAARGRFVVLDRQPEPFWSGVCQNTLQYACCYDDLLNRHGQVWLDALRAEALSRITTPQVPTTTTIAESGNFPEASHAVHV